MNKALKLYHESNRYEVIFTSSEPAFQTKRDHINGVIKMSCAIADIQHYIVDKELLQVLAEHHDDGRVEQYKLFGKFWDAKVSHNILGVERVDRFLQKEGIEPDNEISLLRKVMMYHGREWLIAKATVEEWNYIKIISAADDFENATSCVSYLFREIDTDAKGYIERNPHAEQKIISDEKIWYWYQIGKKFDKITYCNTYADYVLFAATLATNCIKKYNSIAKVAMMQPGYGYESILEGFKFTFEYAMNKSDAQKAFNIISGMLKA